MKCCKTCKCHKLGFKGIIGIILGWLLILAIMFGFVALIAVFIRIIY